MYSNQKSLFLIAAVSLSPSLHADNLDLNLSNDTLGVRYTLPASALDTGVEFDVGWQYSEEASDAENVFSGGLHVSGSNWTEYSEMELKLGVRGIYSSPGDDTFTAIGIGGQVRAGVADRIGIGAGLYYAPSITSFGDADSYMELRIRAEYEVLPNADAYLGWQSISVDHKDRGDADLQEGFHLGISLDL
jgi:hypothetical protein